ncbi:nucleotide exchange factor GrpE [Conexibacter sp. SYSU D00693]|uniref:nucleotide exchange factor GrpE n=1 Tax=Conexibacter sp. SYSU D00693 TaxID=2812560 RepID=UPI00196A2850|nr:nucleotide exchange factor GrpE [Conexibacter sp. SYSU D00693]
MSEEPQETGGEEQVPVAEAADPAAPVEAPDPEPSGDGPAAGAGAPAEAEPDFRDLYLRAAAETENVRKRARRDVELAQAKGVARLARELLPALDNLDRAIAAAEQQEGSGDHEMTKGVRLVQQELLGAMARIGIEPYSPEGEPFDPHHHEAMAQQPVEGVATGTIVTVYQPGYRYKDEVLRAAKVVVAA